MAKLKNDIQGSVKGVSTFKEFFNALKELGYADVSTSTHLRFQKVANSVLSMPMRSVEDRLQESDFRTYAYILYMKGDIENQDDLIKMIEKNRKNAKAEMAFA